MVAWYYGTEATGTLQQEKEEEGKERQEIRKEGRWKEKEEVTERTATVASTTFVQNQLIISTQTSLNFGIKYRLEKRFYSETPFLLTRIVNNKTFSLWRHFTATAIIPFVFPFLFTFCNPYGA